MDPEALIELFAPWARVTVKRMFGGQGVFRDGLMVALHSGDTLYLKSDDESRALFEAEGLEPFSYMKKGEITQLTSYRRMPDACFDDEEALVLWARRAGEAALRAAARKHK